MRFYHKKNLANTSHALYDKEFVILSVAKNPLAKTAKHCHFESFAKRQKIQRILKHALNLWILRCAQYDKGSVILSE